MAKYEYEVEEMLRYRRTIKFETDLEEDELHNLLDRAERHCDDTDHIAHYLEDAGVKIIEYPDNDVSSPHDSEVEGYDLLDL